MHADMRSIKPLRHLAPSTCSPFSGPSELNGPFVSLGGGCWCGGELGPGLAFVLFLFALR